MARLNEYSRSVTRNGSRHTRSSSSRTSADERGRVSESRCPPHALWCSVSRGVVNWRVQCGFGIRTSTVRSFSASPADVTDRLT
jgi:hypothetical protein